MRNMKKNMRTVLITTLVAGMINTPVAGAIINPTYVEDGDKIADATALVDIHRLWENTKVECSGSLIDPEWVITSVHCFDDEDYLIPGGPIAQKENTVSSSIDVLLGLLSFIIPSLTILPSILNNISITDNTNTSSTLLSSGSSMTPLSSIRIKVSNNTNKNIVNDENYLVNDSIIRDAEPLIIQDAEPIEIADTNEEVHDRYAASVTLGPQRGAGEEVNVVAAYANPAGYRESDMVLLKLEKPVDVTPIPLATEKPKYNSDTRTYGWSKLSNDSTTLRYLTGKTRATNYDKTITSPYNGAKTEPGDSGGPVINENGELIAVHKSSSKNSKNAKTYGALITTHYDWIINTINTK